jgi:ribonuclease J
MIELIRPKCFIPVHGTIHHLTRHAELARQVGVEHVSVIENGRIAEVSASGLDVSATAHTGRVHVWAGRAIPPAILRERQVLAEEGFASCAVVVDGRAAVVEITLLTRGVVDESEHPGELEAARAAVRRAIGELSSSADDARIGEEARLAVRRTFFKSRGKKPMTVVHVRRSP